MRAHISSSRLWATLLPPLPLQRLPEWEVEEEEEEEEEVSLTWLRYLMTMSTTLMIGWRLPPPTTTTTTTSCSTTTTTTTTTTTCTCRML